MMFLLLLFSGYKAYENIFSSCLPINGGSPWYPSNQLEHWAAALSAIGTAAHPGEPDLLPAFKPSDLNLPRSENTRQCDTQAHAAGSISQYAQQLIMQSHLWHFES